MSADALRAIWRDDERPGSVVYFILNPSNGLVKIGRTQSLAARLATFRTAIPDLELLGTFPGGPMAEGDMHATFASQRVAGEWFAFDLKMATIIRGLCGRRATE